MHKIGILLKLLGTRVPLSFLAILISSSLSRRKSNKEMHRWFAFVQRYQLEFSSNWFIRNVENWEFIVRTQKPFETSSPLALEIGSYEGQSAAYLLSLSPKVKIDCVDSWAAFRNEEGEMSGTIDPIVERRFDANLAPFANRFTKFKSRSSTFWDSLAEPREYDWIYIDGSHFVGDVAHDLFCGFQNLRVGGLLVIDDYLWFGHKINNQNVAAAVHFFFSAFRKNLGILHVGNQVIFLRKS